jgi:hypothetical protein
MNKNEVRKIEAMKRKLKHNHSDLIQTVQKNYAIRLGVIILWYVFIYVGFKRYFNTDGTVNYIILYYGLLLIAIGLPFYILKIHRIFIDSTWKGTVTKIMLTTDVIRSIPKTANKIVVHYEIVHIKHEYNDKKEWEMKLRKCDNDFNPVGYYKQGEEVMHYKGLKFCEKLNKSLDEYIICLYCGQLAAPAQDTCTKCKHTIVK